MKADSYRFDGSGKCRLDKLATDSKADGVDKEKILAKTAENLQKMAALQDAFYADGREGLIFVLQAMGRRRQGQHHQACDVRPEPTGRAGDQF